MRDMTRFPITARVLEDMAACQEQIDLFVEIFSYADQVIISEDTLLKALNGGLDLAWFLRHSVSEEVYRHASINIARQAGYFLRSIITQDSFRSKYIGILIDAFYTEIDMHDTLDYAKYLPGKDR